MSYSQIEVKKIELVPGHGVVLTQRQLDAANASSKGNPTRQIRSLVSVFFTPEVLAISSAMGTRRHQALDSEIVEACICKSADFQIMCNQSIKFQDLPLQTI